tara:strand:+ start:6 stop:347 length:342 start_codon:yes stop_codon:yes gene_type:complete
MLDETIFHKSHIIGIDEVVKGVTNRSPKIREISFRDFMLEFNDEFHSFMDVDNFSVVWETIDGEIHIKEIFDADTGNPVWRPPIDEFWDENDDVIVSSLLMFGELEQQIGVGI